MKHKQHLTPSLLSAGLVGLIALASTSAAAAPLTLVRDGATDYALVVAADASEAEAYAAGELTNFVQRATGVLLPVVEEAAHAGGPAIYLGQTAFAVGQGIDLDALGQEEWVLRAVDGNLMLTGGRPRGTLYAVYEFLETQLGVRFLDVRTVHVPEHAALDIPADWDVRDRPVFDRREIGSLTHLPFTVRLKLNSFANAWRMIPARYGYSIKFGSPYTTHTHHRYVRDFPEAFDKTAHLARTASGRPNTQVCMSHPEVRQSFIACLREYIRRDREALRAEGRGPDAYPIHYSLVPDDGSEGKCVCERCMHLEAQYGSYAGVVLEFTNEIADAIAEDHPEIVLHTSAYLYYRDIPTGIRPRDNVVVKLAQLGAEFNTLPRRDPFRSMLHPLNEKPRREWEDWGAISPVLGVHDYWTPWSQMFPWPHANIRGLAETIRFYHQCGLKHFFTEAPRHGANTVHNFMDLQYYLASRLFQNPEQPAEPIIAEFAGLYYGPAAPQMLKLLEYIETRQEEEEGYLAAVQPAARAYFDAAFFIETDEILSEAEAAVADHADILANVRQERLAIDTTMLYLWHALEEEAGADWPFDRETALARLEANHEHIYDKYGRVRADHGWAVSARQRLEYLRDMTPIPERFAGRSVIDLCGPFLRLAQKHNRPVPRGPVQDPEAATGRTWRLETYTWQEGRSAEHERAPEFGLLDRSRDPHLVRRVLEPDEIPTDERYHWYFVGRALGSSTLYFYAHHSWVFDRRLHMTFNAALPDQHFYDVYVSLKLEGPAYVPGSKRDNAFSVDRLILVEVDPDEPEGAL